MVWDVDGVWWWRLGKRFWDGGLGGFWGGGVVDELRGFVVVWGVCGCLEGRGAHGNSVVVPCGLGGMVVGGWLWNELVGW